jgi:hypothetical protein
MQTVHINYVMAQDEDGVWCADAPAVHAHGYGDTQEAALEMLREGVLDVIENEGAPQELEIRTGRVA